MLAQWHKKWVVGDCLPFPVGSTANAMRHKKTEPLASVSQKVPNISQGGAVGDDRNFAPPFYKLLKLRWTLSAGKVYSHQL